MFFSKKVLMLVLPFFMHGLAGCTAEYTKSMINDSLAGVDLRDSHDLYRHNNWRVDPNSRLYLSRTDIVGYYEKDMPRSIGRLEIEIEQSFKENFDQLYIAPRYKNEGEVSLTYELLQAQYAGAQFMVKPRFIRLINDINTTHELKYGKNAYPGKDKAPDQTILQFRVYDVLSQSLLDVASVSSRQQYLADENSVASDLFGPAIDHYLHSLVAVR